MGTNDDDDDDAQTSSSQLVSEKEKKKINPLVRSHLSTSGARGLQKALRSAFSGVLKIFVFCSSYFGESQH